MAKILAASFSLAGAELDWPTCGCSWAMENGCGNDDGSTCWHQCCGWLPSPSPSPTPAPWQPSCDCSWAKGPSFCELNDGSTCWHQCCDQWQQPCDCNWASSGCGDDDGSTCWHQCCGSQPSPSPSPTPSPTPPGCDCSWAASGCGSNDGSTCWHQCCWQPSCDCSWAASGCGKDDGSACFHQCCGFEMANSTNMQRVAPFVSLPLVTSAPCPVVPNVNFLMLGYEGPEVASIILAVDGVDDFEGCCQHFADVVSDNPPGEFLDVTAAMNHCNGESFRLMSISMVVGEADCDRNQSLIQDSDEGYGISTTMADVSDDCLVYWTQVVAQRTRPYSDIPEECKCRYCLTQTGPPASSVGQFVRSMIV